jgi:hypothetical protein
VEMFTQCHCVKMINLIAFRLCHRQKLAQMPAKT